jgi:predicted O-methyltransferase YrrM
MAIFATVAGVICAFLVLRMDLHRRRLALRRASGWSPLIFLDVAWPPLLSATVAASAILSIPVAISIGAIPLDAAATWRIVVGLCIVAFVWKEGQRQIQFQRPRGIVCGESLILVGIYVFVESLFYSTSNVAPVPKLAFRTAAGSSILAGSLLIGVIVQRTLKRYEGLRILDHFEQYGESVQPEYVPATAECLHPERWKMTDAQTAELEVLDFLKSFVLTVKPALVVETGTFLGYSTLKMAEALKSNGFGKIITIELDPAIFAKANERFGASGLREWIENRNESSLDAKIEGTIDLLFSDSHGPLREQEVRRFLPQIAPGGLILMHDSSPHFRFVREAAVKLESEGLISLVFLPTPRGLLIAQKLQGRP